jgi:glycosyltransferase involved in cell wall biosynthesis
MTGAMAEAGHDVHLFPMSVVPPIPFHIAEMLTKWPDPPFDAVVCHLSPADSRLVSKPIRGASPRLILWCHDPAAKVLTDQLEWVDIVKLQRGDGIIAFDDEPTPSAWTPDGAKRTASVRKFRTARVQATHTGIMPRCRVVTDGESTVVTPNHRFLVVRGRYTVWVETQDLVPGDSILSIPMWGTDETYEAGYLAGQFDGEGHLSPLTGPPRQRQAYANLAWSQAADSPLVGLFEAMMTSKGFRTSRYIFGRKDKPGHLGRDTAVVTVRGGWVEILRCLGTIRPKRMLANPHLSALWEHRGVRGLPRSVVERVEVLPDGPMVAIQTDTHTYIADGLLSHNTMWEYERYRPDGWERTRVMLEESEFDLILAYDEVTAAALSDEEVNPGVPVRVLQGGFSPEYWSRADPRARDWSGTFRFAMVGRLDPRKNPWAAIRAFGRLKDEHGEEFDAELHLKTTIPGLIPPQVGERWPGIHIHLEWWTPERMLEFYAATHCLLAPSTGEGKNVPALEAMTTGIPVIATDYGGHRGWLSPEYAYPLGWTPHEFAAGPAAQPDEDELAELMWHVYTHRDEARGKGEVAARVIPPAMSWASVVRRLTAVMGQWPLGDGHQHGSDPAAPGHPWIEGRGDARERAGTGAGRSAVFGRPPAVARQDEAVG